MVKIKINFIVYSKIMINLPLLHTRTPTHTFGNTTAHLSPKSGHRFPTLRPAHPRAARTPRTPSLAPARHVSLESSRLPHPCTLPSCILAAVCHTTRLTREWPNVNVSLTSLSLRAVTSDENTSPDNILDRVTQYFIWIPAYPFSEQQAWAQHTIPMQ